MNLERPGFYVIEIRKFQEVSHTLPPYQTMSIINILREIESGKLRKLVVVDGLDEFLKSSDDEAITQVRKALNKAVADMLASEASIIFVVRSDLEGIPDSPKIHRKPLTMLFPRPHDIGSMEPGYLYYPIM